MNIQQITDQIEKIGERIFKYSLQENVGIEKLAEAYKEALDVRDSFLELRFNGVEVEELEMKRFYLLDYLLTLKIMIKEKLGYDITEENIKLKNLYGF